MRIRTVLIVLGLVAVLACADLLTGGERVQDVYQEVVSLLADSEE
jgi:hypothetical protein